MASRRWSCAIFPVVRARPARLFSTMSNRMRGDAPYAVAFRRNTGENRSSASAPTSALDEDLAARVGRLGIRRGLFGDEGLAARAVDAA